MRDPALFDPVAAVDRLRAAFGGPAAHRTLHAKGRFYAGTFTPTHEAGELGRARHLHEPTPVLVRWSNAGGNAAVPDRAPDIRGMAVKFRLTDGTATDLLGQTSPRFPTDDPEEFVAMTEASVNKLTFPLFLARHPRMVPAIAAGVRGKAISSPGASRRRRSTPSMPTAGSMPRTAVPGCGTSSCRGPPARTGSSSASPDPTGSSRRWRPASRGVR